MKLDNPIILAKKLVKKYDDFIAVNGIDFEIQPGECFGFLGPNGAGKTSTMQMLYRGARVSSGKLEILGWDATSEKNDRMIKAGIGVIPQEDNLDKELSVQETLIVFARFYGVTGNKAIKTADRLLEFVDLQHKANVPIQTLSGGMKQRALIARSLVGNPKIILLDEPTTGLDPKARGKLWEQLVRLKEEGKTLVLTTHYMNEAHTLCDRLVIMDQGHIVASGTPDELIKAHQGAEDYSEKNANLSPLEAVFIKLTQDERGFS